MELIRRYSDIHDTQIVERSGGESRLEGYAIVWYDGSPKTEFRQGNLVERVLPDALDLSKQTDPVVLRFNHSTRLDIRQYREYSYSDSR